MTSINTVKGPRNSADLGRTLIHEHVMVGLPGWYLDHRRPKLERNEAMARAVDAFSELHRHGVRTVVDPCPMDLGRDVVFSAEVAERSGINLVCSTGIYNESMGAAWVFRAMQVDEIAEIYVREIEEGIGDTGIKAGVIKIATGAGGVTKFERRVLTAAARAARLTGVPIVSHTEKCSCGHDQIDIVTHEGVDASRLLVGHSDGRDDPDYQRSIAERGAYVGFDRFGMDMIIVDAIRMKNLKALVDAGHLNRVMMSHDSTECMLGGVAGVLGAQSLRDIAPNSKLTHIFETILPQLREMGMKDADFDRILVDNPRRFFESGANQA